MKVWELKEKLEEWPDDFEITFSDGLGFFQLTSREPNCVNMEFNQQIYKDSTGRWHIEDPFGPSRERLEMPRNAKQIDCENLVLSSDGFRSRYPVVTLLIGKTKKDEFGRRFQVFRLTLEGIISIEYGATIEVRNIASSEVVYSFVATLVDPDYQRKFTGVDGSQQIER